MVLISHIEKQRDDLDGRFQTYDSRLRAVELIQKSVLEKLTVTEQILVSINAKVWGMEQSNETSNSFS